MYSQWTACTKEILYASKKCQRLPIYSFMGHGAKLLNNK